MLRTSAINLVLKIGLAVTGIVFAILSFLAAPDIIVLYPHFIISLVGEIVTLALGAATALILSIWLLSRKHKFASAFTFFIFVSLGMLFNLTSLSFLSIAWPLFCMSLALCLRYYPRVRVIFNDKKGNEKMKIVPAILADEVNEKDATKNSYGDETPFEENESGNDFAHKFAAASNAYVQDLLATPVTTFKDFRSQFDHPVDSTPEEQILPSTYENEIQLQSIDSDPVESTMSEPTMVKDDVRAREFTSTPTPSESNSEHVKSTKDKDLKTKTGKATHPKARIKIAKAPRIRAIKHKDDDVIAYDEPEFSREDNHRNGDHFKDDFSHTTQMPKKAKRVRKSKIDLI